MPGSRFYVLVVDGLPNGVSLPESVRLVTIDELGIVDAYEMCFKYDVTELSTAVKAKFLQLLMEKYGESKVAYLDPDIVVFQRLRELELALSRSAIVVTPHTMVPIPMDDETPSE